MNRVYGFTRAVEREGTTGDVVDFGTQPGDVLAPVVVALLGCESVAGGFFGGGGVVGKAFEEVPEEVGWHGVSCV